MFSVHGMMYWFDFQYTQYLFTDFCKQESWKSNKALQMHAFEGYMNGVLSNCNRILHLKTWFTKIPHKPLSYKWWADILVKTLKLNKMEFRKVNIWSKQYKLISFSEQTSTIENIENNLFFLNLDQRFDNDLIMMVSLFLIK